MTILHALLAIASGSLVGFTLGLVGGGGSILAVPLLVYVVGVRSPHIAIGTSAIAVAASAAANLAGHIHVDDYAIIGGLTGIHQFTRIGAHCIIGGASAVAKDVPPFVMASGNYAKLYGLNVIGLKRRGFKEETIQALKKAYRIVFRSSLLLSVAIAKVKAEVDDLPEVRQFVEFIETRSSRGISR